MITANWKSGVTLLVIMFLLVSFTGNAQKIHFAKNEKTANVNDIIYTVGSENENVFVWMYKYNEDLLQLNIYDSTMNLLAQKSLSFPNLSNVRGIDFFQKNNVYDVVVHYFLRKKVRNEVFFYDKLAGTIQSLQVLSEGDVSGGMIIKYSTNGKYTGLIQAFSTKDDSTLLQYSLFNSNKQLEKDFVFLLPYKHSRLSFESSLIDTAGNLFFTEVNNRADSDSKEGITIYEVNPRKDSLLLNDIVRTGVFENLHILQNKTTGRLTLSGTWLAPNTYRQPEAGKSYLFLMDLNNDLSQNGEMTLFALDKIIDSVYASSFELRSQNIVLNKDSGYVFYFSGLVGQNRHSLETNKYPNSRSRNNKMANSDSYSSNYENNIGSTTDAGNFYRKPAVTTPSPEALPNHPATYDPLPSHYDAPKYSPPMGSGPSHNPLFLPDTKNFFMTMSVNKNNINAVNHFKDTTPGQSFAGYDYVANSGRGIHYLYSRELKNNKQLVFDVVLTADGTLLSYPVIINPKYNLLLRNGVQVSANSVVFPYVSHTYNASFAKLDLK